MHLLAKRFVVQCDAWDIKNEEIKTNLMAQPSPLH